MVKGLGAGKDVKGRKELLEGIGWDKIWVVLGGFKGEKKGTECKEST